MRPLGGGGVDLSSPRSIEGPLEVGLDAGSPSLWIQTVLYRPADGAVDRFLRGLRAATSLARSRGWFRSITVAMGDCSPVKVIPYGRDDEMAADLAPYGIDRFAYRFFNENLGSAGGHNALLTEYDGDLVLIVNPDVYISPDIFSPLLRGLDTPQVGIVEARQIPLEHPKSFDPQTGDTSWASTACALVRSEVIADTGGFDATSFFLYCDDVDFSWRARLAGWQIVHQPAARVFHDKRLTRDAHVEVGAAELYYSAEASLLMAWKFSRPDLVERWSDDLSATGSPEHQRAVDSFRRRRLDGTLPSPLDPDHRVSQFFGYGYAEPRFSYA